MFFSDSLRDAISYKICHFFPANALLSGVEFKIRMMPNITKFELSRAVMHFICNSSFAPHKSAAFIYCILLYYEHKLVSTNDMLLRIIWRWVVGCSIMYSQNSFEVSTSCRHRCHISLFRCKYLSILHSMYDTLHFMHFIVGNHLPVFIYSANYRRVYFTVYKCRNYVHIKLRCWKQCVNNAIGIMISLIYPPIL